MTDEADKDALVNAAELGEEAKAFMGSELGKRILELADREVEHALAALGEVDASDAEAVRKLQMEAKFGRAFAQWLLNIVHEGEQAIQVFQQQRQTE